MPRVKKKSVEYGNRIRRRKLAAAKRSVFYYPQMVDGAQRALQMTGEMPPTPPLTCPDPDEFKTDNDFKNQDAFPKKIENPDSKFAIFNTAGIKTEKMEEYRPTRPIKGLSDLISKSIITADDAAAAVTAVTTMASLKKALSGHKEKTPKQPKQPKPPKQTRIKVSLPVSKAPVLPKTSTPGTTATPNKLMVNFKGLGKSASTGGNTQKAYALYVGGQLKYILPYNGPLGAINSTSQQNNEMKKLICRGVNGKTEIALAKPTVVCDEEKKKIVFVVQKKATTAPASSLLSSSNNTDNKILKIPSLATLSTTSGQSLQGNHIISDNMLKLLLPAVSASFNSNTPITLPSHISASGQGQKARTTPQQTTPQITQQTSQNQQTPLEKVPAPSSVPIVVKVQSNASQSMSTATTTTTTTTSSSSSSSIPTTPTTTTAMTNVTPQTSPVSSSSNSPGSVRPVQLFTRDSARNLCPGPLVLSSGNKPCMTILDPAEPGANIRPGKSLLGSPETAQQSVNQILVKKTSGDSSVILQFKDAAGVSSFLSASDKDPKLPDQSPTYTNDAQLQLNSQTVTPVSLPNCNKNETMPANTAPACEEEGSANDEDDGMFGLKISSVFSLAENQPSSVANEAVISQGRKLVHNSAPASFQQDQIPADTLATAMKLAVSTEETKPNNETNNAEGEDSLSNQRTVIFNLNNISSQSQQENLQIMLDTSPSKQNSLLKSSISKSSVNVKLEPQTLASFDPDLESVLSGKLSVDTQTMIHSQKENASPKKGASLVGPEKDFIPGQKYITVDIFRHNGQTKITAVSSSGKKEGTKPALPNGNSEGASGSTSDESKSTLSTSDPRINEVLQCAAYSLPMGTYFFIPLADKIVAIPSQRRKKNRSAYIFEKNHNFMQVKMAKYMLLNSKDKLPTSVVTTNGSQLICQISTPTKTNGGPSIVLPVTSVSPAKDTIPTLEAPPIVTGKRIRRPKKHTGFEEDMDLIPPLRKCRKKLKPVIKTDKIAKEQMCNDKNSRTVSTKLESKDTDLDHINKLMLQPVDSKEELAAVLRSVDMPATTSKNNNATSYVYVHPPGVNVNASKVETSVSRANETSFQEPIQSGLHIDNVQSLQSGGIKIKPEPITSGYGDEPVKPPLPLLAPAPSVASPVQVGHDASGLPLTIKKEPSWYGYGQDTSSPPVIYRMNTSSTSTSHSGHMSTPNMNLKNAAFGPHTQPPALYKKDSPTKSLTGKKRGRKKKEPDQIKPKRKYVRHKTHETVVGVTTQTQTPLSGLTSTLSNSPLKTEMKTESPEPTLMGSSNQSGETPQEERIRRLKEILREKEQKLEEIRLNMSVSTTI